MAPSTFATKNARLFSRGEARRRLFQPSTVSAAFVFALHGKRKSPPSGSRSIRPSGSSVPMTGFPLFLVVCGYGRPQFTNPKTLWRWPRLGGGRPSSNSALRISGNSSRCYVRAGVAIGSSFLSSLVSLSAKSFRRMHPSHMPPCVNPPGHRAIISRNFCSSLRNGASSRSS